MKKFVLSLMVALMGISASAQVYVGGEAGFWRNSDENQTNFNISITINDVAGAGTLSANTYKVVVIG